MLQGLQIHLGLQGREIGKDGVAEALLNLPPGVEASGSPIAQKGPLFEGKGRSGCSTSYHQGPTQSLQNPSKFPTIPGSLQPSPYPLQMIPLSLPYPPSVPSPPGASLLLSTSYNLLT